jgi:serine protease
LLLVCVRGLTDEIDSDVFMRRIGRLLLVLAFGCALGPMFGPAHAEAAAAVPEWNTVRAHPVSIGPEAGRLVVGFRATAGNTVVKTIKLRARTQSVKIAQAQTSGADVAGLAQRTGVAMASSRQITPSMHVLVLQKMLYGADVNVVLKSLRADPSVQFADVDLRRYPHALPDDPLFVPSPSTGGQWYTLTPSATTIMVDGIATMDLAATDAVSAWAITTGSSGMVIADVDSGVRFDHPDLLRAGFGGRLLPGYDFVGGDLNRTTGAALGTFLVANDGDGWDADPSDPGDWINSTDEQNSLFPVADCAIEDSSWHGTRVVGVLGALTNNDVGIAGMTWKPYILPVRALGKCGGYDSDIIAGMQWSAGMSVEGVPDNPYPADIINLSLGGSSSCLSDYQSVIGTLSGMGVLIVASAGNGGSTVDAPANCPGVLAVAGLRNVGTKVGYSSFGAEVGISAPAGNCVETSGACLRSIDTTTNLGLTTPGNNGYTDQINYNLGTSFSAPIVSGIAALMRAVNANLTPAQLIARIESSASAFPQPAGLPQCPTLASDGSGECACVRGQCGAGMVNALSAVRAALNPIAAVAVPATVSAGNNAVFDASGSVAACNLTVASYAWTATGGVTIQSSANAAHVTVVSGGSTGTLTLTVTDSAGSTDAATISFTSTGATTTAPPSAGTAAAACPTPITVTPVAPTVTAAFSPASVGESVASTLTITFKNANGFDLTQSGFSETVPANLSIQTSPAPTTTCPGASGTLTSSTSTVTLVGANIPANGSCSVTLSVKSAAAGNYTNAIAANALSTAPAGGNSASSSTSLTVMAPSSGGGGGGALDWPDMMFAAGVILAGRRHAGRRPSR